MEKVNLTHKLGQFQEHWSPKIVGDLNGQQVKLVKFRGEFPWHSHATEDEMFLVLKGGFRMDYREHGVAASLELEQGEFVIVPRGMEHRPVAEQEAHVMLFEPDTTLNTGNVRCDMTIDQPDRL